MSISNIKLIKLTKNDEEIEALDSKPLYKPAFHSKANQGR